MSKRPPKTPFTILDLLADVGANNLHYQVLSEALCGKQKAIPDKKTGRLGDHGTQFTFASPEDLGAVAVHRTRDAIVLWGDRSKFEKAWAKLKAAETAAVEKKTKPKKRGGKHEALEKEHGGPRPAKGRSSGRQGTGRRRDH